MAKAVCSVTFTRERGGGSARLMYRGVTLIRRRYAGKAPTAKQKAAARRVLLAECAAQVRRHKEEMGLQRLERLVHAMRFDGAGSKYKWRSSTGGARARVDAATTLFRADETPYPYHATYSGRDVLLPPVVTDAYKTPAKALAALRTQVRRLRIPRRLRSQG